VGGKLKYIVQIEIDPDIGAEFEEDPAGIQEFIGKWQALNPVGMYFALTRRAVTVIVDVPNEDSMFEAIHHTWLVTRNYPEIWPVADLEGFGAIMHRLGMTS
tara:strand:- start:51 stop:356 length:306 start_codon:yes stop_codon:yes gene_type:complete